jgi:mycoredoxin
MPQEVHNGQLYIRGKILLAHPTKNTKNIPIRKSSHMTDLYTLTPSQIVMYTTDYCLDCLRAKKFFETNNIPHIRVGLEGNPEASEFVIQVNNGYRSVPTIVFPDGSVLVEPGWDELRAKISNS